MHKNKSKFTNTTFSMVTIHIQIDIYAQTSQKKSFLNLNLLYHLMCLMGFCLGVNDCLKIFRMIDIIFNDTRNTLVILFTSSDIALTPTSTISSQTANIYSWSSADHWKLYFHCTCTLEIRTKLNNCVFVNANICTLLFKSGFGFSLLVLVGSEFLTDIHTQ